MLQRLEIQKQVFKPIMPEKLPPLWAMEKYFNFYENELKPSMAGFVLQPLDGMHGLNTHTSAVVLRGIDYALHIGRDPMPVVFACAFHDISRINDNWDTEHGRNAIPNAIKIMKKFPDLFDKDTRLSIYSAIMNHTTGAAAPDYISACLWDADRTRLSWKYGFEEKFFNTQRGKYVAQHYKSFLEFQAHYFPQLKNSKEY